MSDSDAAPRSPWTPRFALAVIVVAVAAAGFAIAFRWTLAAALRLVSGLANTVQAMTSAPWWVRIGAPVLGALAAGLIAMRVKSQNVGDVMEAATTGTTKLSLVTTTIKSLASWCAIVTGGSLGREGPLIQFGGAAGYAISDRFAIDPLQRRTLIAAGTAAGFAAAYNTPLAAVAFVLEIVLGVITVETVVPTLCATVIATLLTRAVVGTGPLYGARAFTLTSPGELLAFAGVGLVAGVAAVAFGRLVALGERGFHRLLAPPWRQAVGGLGAGLVILVLPQVAGNGYEPLNQILSGQLAITVVAWLLLAKAFATTSSVAAGNPGGVFTPTMLLGGCVGYLCGAALAAAGADVGPAGGYALIGMAAAIAAATHAPLMAAILAFELSGDYAIVLPLVLATALATGLARALYRDSIYTAELKKPCTNLNKSKASGDQPTGVGNPSSRSSSNRGSSLIG